MGQRDGKLFRGGQGRWKGKDARQRRVGENRKLLESGIHSKVGTHPEGMSRLPLEDPLMDGGKNRAGGLR